MRDIPVELTRGPFTVARARELGLTIEVLGGRRFRRPWTGVRVLADTPDTLVVRCRAAALVLPSNAAFSHGTAISLAGWLSPLVGDRESRAYKERPLDPDEPVHVSVTDGHAPQGRGLVPHRFMPAADDVIDVDGLRVTSPWRTWCDLAASGADHHDLVILADALRRRFPGVAARRLAERLDAWGSRRGARALRRALDASRDRVDSPMETRLRLLCVEGGLPEPEVNHWVRLEDGTPIHQPDLSWPKWKVAADYDGVHHAERDEDAAIRGKRASNWRQRQDNSRRDLMDEAQWRLRIFTAFDVFQRGDASVERMRTTLRAAGAPV
jgi:hypothetical protein